jgi:hypothetical protein
MTSSSAFEHLQARPPTPPRDISRGIDDALAYLEDSFDTVRLLEDSLPTTINPALAEYTPPSSADFNRSGSNKKRKRVDFSPWTNYHKAPDKHSSSFRPLPIPSRDTKPLKSILKTPEVQKGESLSIEESYLCSSKKFENFPEMLTAAIQQLAASGKEGRLDAYLTMNNSLRSWEQVVGLQELQGKMGLLNQFMERDMMAYNDATNSPDSALATQAIKLLLTLMRIPGLTDTMDVEFKTFMIERTISVLMDESVPKAIINHHLFFLAQQNFGPKIVTSQRSEKIIDSLKDIHHRVKGNNVITYRLLTYHRLVKQQPSVMETRISAWFDHVFYGMLNSMREIRSHAIELGFTAGNRLGCSRQASKGVMDMLNHLAEGGKTYAEFVADKLKKMAKKKEEPSHAPKIWSIIVLFTRGRKQGLDSWRHFRTWLVTFNDFVNTHDANVRIQSHLAWNRFIYVLGPIQKVSTEMITLLQITALKVHIYHSEKLPSPAVREAAFAGYLTLLYYAFRPDTPTHNFDRLWSELVSPVLEKMLEDGDRGLKRVCGILRALFTGTSSRIWNEFKALENEPVQLEDLPRLDPKWVRHNFRTIIYLVERCVCSHIAQNGDEQFNAVLAMWDSLMLVVQEAGCKEVTASMELKDVIAHTMNLLQYLWLNKITSQVDQLNHSEQWYNRYGSYIESSMQHLGPVHFTEKNLIWNSSQTFQAAPTPSHRTKIQSPSCSPLQHLFSLILEENTDHSSIRGLSSLMRRIVTPCVASRPSKQAKFSLLHECAQNTGPGETNSHLRFELWAIIAEMARNVLLDPVAAQDSHARSLGQEYHDALSIMVTGYLHDSFAPEAPGVFHSFFTALINDCVREAGYEASILAIVEPLSDVLANRLVDSNLHSTLTCTTLILSHLQHPANHRIFAQANKLLWGVDSTPSKITNFDPYSELYSLVTAVSLSTYNSFHLIPPSHIKAFLTALSASITKCPIYLAGVFLRKIQSAVSIWIEDPKQHLKPSVSNEENPYPEVCAKVSYSFLITVALTLDKLGICSLAISWIFVRFFASKGYYDSESI